MSDVLIKADFKLDARGLNCPMPVMEAKKALQNLQSGQTINIIASDAESFYNFPQLCKQPGIELIEMSNKDGDYHFYIRKG